MLPSRNVRKLRRPVPANQGAVSFADFRANEEPKQGTIDIADDRAHHEPDGVTIGRVPDRRRTCQFQEENQCSREYIVVAVGRLR